jgi:Rod binding domain-containing protein
MKLAAINTLAPVKPEPADAAQKQKLTEATKQFEAVLIRQMLTSLERTTQLSSSSKGALGGSSAYSSMMVDALSDAIAQAGGLGLAKTLDGMLAERVTESVASEAPAGNSPKSAK